MLSVNNNIMKQKQYVFYNIILILKQKQWVYYKIKNITKEMQLHSYKNALFGIRIL